MKSFNLMIEQFPYLASSWTFLADLNPNSTNSRLNVEEQFVFSFAICLRLAGLAIINYKIFTFIKWSILGTIS